MKVVWTKKAWRGCTRDKIQNPVNRKKRNVNIWKGCCWAQSWWGESVSSLTRWAGRPPGVSHPPNQTSQRELSLDSQQVSFLFLFLFYFFFFLLRDHSPSKLLAPKPRFKVASLLIFLIWIIFYRTLTWWLKLLGMNGQVPSAKNIPKQYWYNILFEGTSRSAGDFKIVLHLGLGKEPRGKLQYPNIFGMTCKRTKLWVVLYNWTTIGRMETVGLICIDAYFLYMCS